MNNLFYGIVPLAGTASRMNNLPKFLLPCDLNISLLDNTINIFNKNNINEIFTGISEFNNYIIKSNTQLKKIIVKTKTMSETCYEIVKEIDKNNYNYKCILIMPDTKFIINNELLEMQDKLNYYDIVVLVWKIKDYQIGKVGQCKIVNNKVVDVIDKDINCDYQYLWGVIGWNSNMNKYIDPKWETIGELLKKTITLNIDIYAIICEGTYYDCGTYSEYFKMINENIIL